MSGIDFSQRLVVPEESLFREIDGESVLLSLKSDSLFSLNRIGTRVWYALVTSVSIAEAEQKLLQEYDVNPDELRQELEDLIRQLLDQGLLRYADGESAK